MAAAIDLTTAAKVRVLLQDDDQYEETLLEAAITAASRAILNHTKREFAPKTADPEAREVLYRAPGGLIDLSPFDLRAAPVSVTLDSDGASPIVLEAGDYLSRPIPAPLGVKEWLAIRRPQTFDYGHDWPRVVTVEGQWGFAEVPEDVAHWCGITVMIWLRDDVSAFSTSFVVEEGRLKRPEDLPSAVVAGLRHYRRRSVA